MIDEPLVVPFSPGEAIVRLCRVQGALQQHDALARVLPPASGTRLAESRTALLHALEANDRAMIATALRAAQDELRRLYEAACQPGLWAPGQAPAHFALLGFPDPLEKGLGIVDAATVLATFTKPARQVLTTLSFEPAPGALAYWVHEVRFLRGEALLDAIVESNAPMFTRLRLPLGTHTFRIESRNASQNVFSEEFSLEVPAL